MKKLMMTMIAAVMMSSAAFAQDNQKECKCSEKKADNTEMVKHRTDKMVKKYGLNDQQAAQLLEVNTKYSDKMEPRGQHHHPGKGRPPKDGKKMDKKTDGNTGATAQQPQESKRQELTEEQKAKFEAERKEHEATRQAYEGELQKIMTPEQFKNYQEDMKKHGDRGPRGPRPDKKDKQ